MKTEFDLLSVDIIKKMDRDDLIKNLKNNNFPKKLQEGDINANAEEILNLIKNKNIKINKNSYLNQVVFFQKYSKDIDGFTKHKDDVNKIVAFNKKKKINIELADNDLLDDDLIIDINKLSDAINIDNINISDIANIKTGKYAPTTENKKIFDIINKLDTYELEIITDKLLYLKRTKKMKKFIYII